MKYITKKLETERLVLKRGSLEDFQKVYEYDFRKLCDILGECEKVKQDPAAIAGFETYADEDDAMDWILYLKESGASIGAPIGNISADRMRPDIGGVELAFNVHPDHWGRGYMPEACRAVMHYLFSIGFTNIICGYSEGNVKSKRVGEKLGFEPYEVRENAWVKNGVPITDYDCILSKEKFYRLNPDYKSNDIQEKPTMNQENIRATKALLDFITPSVTAFHATAEIGRRLEANGFVRLSEAAEWNLTEGGKYYVTRNNSSVIAFAIPAGAAKSFMITASHTDSPTYKLKNETETEAFGKYVKLNVESYGGGINSTWLDKPLSIAGRVIVKENGRIVTRLITIDRDLVLIPNVAPHQSRTVNNGQVYNNAVDMMPLLCAKDKKGALKQLVADEAGCAVEDILCSDLYLYNRTHPSIWGIDEEFFSTPRIDNLQCAYTTFEGFLDAVNAGECKALPVYSAFDNEETGSSTKQGANSQFLFDTLSEVAKAVGTTLPKALAASFMVSADNGHAKHPNHPELSDGLNAPHMNEGVVIKSNASQKYTTDALSCAIFTEICRNAGVPVQQFANRSDMGGGSTLGSISNTNVALNTVDIGLAQLAMHSAYETGGTADTLYMIQAIAAFYRTVITSDGDGIYRVG